MDTDEVALLELAQQRHGTDAAVWAFRCPGCGDVITGTCVDEAADTSCRCAVHVPAALSV